MLTLKVKTVALTLMIGLASTAHGTELPRLAQSNNAFGLKLLNEVRCQRVAENTLVSPVSAFMALSMLYNGARGETSEGIGATLNLDGLSRSELNDLNKTFFDGLKGQPGEHQLVVANSLWVKQGLQLQPTYRERMKTSYFAEIKEMNFLSRSSSGIINTWISKNTFGKITNAVPNQLDPRLLLYLINTTYFKGQWQSPFNEEATADELFHFEGERQPELKSFMSRDGHYRHVKTDFAEAVELPYLGGKSSMVIILPNESVADLAPQLTSENWETLIGELKGANYEYGTVKLPKFSFDFKTGLERALSALGMSVAFTPQADFGDMLGRPAMISEAFQKTFISVDENGTEAAAATIIGAMPTSMPEHNFTFAANRPFVFSIIDQESGAILFIGSMMNPTL